MKKLIIFASGTKTGGGSGFRKLVENSRTGMLEAKIVAVASNHRDGGVRRHADALKIPFIYFPAPWDAESYKKMVQETRTDYVVLSGWLKLTIGLDPRHTINIHPGPLPHFGGKNLYGHHIHKAIIDAFKRGEIKKSAVSMHFVTKAYDRGPVFFRYPVLIREDDTPETLAQRVQKIEHAWQSWVTNLVVNEKIYWDGTDPKSLIVPPWYPYLLK